MRFFRKPDGADATGDAIPFFHDGQQHIFSLTPPPATGTYPERLRTTWRIPFPTISWIGAISVRRDPRRTERTGLRRMLDRLRAVRRGHVPRILHRLRDPRGVPADDLPRHQPRRRDLDEGRRQPDPAAQDRPLREPGLAGSLCVLQRGRQALLDDPLSPSELWSDRKTRLRRPLPFDRPRDLGALWSDLRAEAHQLPRVPGTVSHRRHWYLSYSRFSEFGGTIYRMSDNPFGGWRTPKRDRIGNRRFYAAKSMADDKGGRYYFGWTPDRADTATEATGSGAGSSPSRTRSRPPSRTVSSGSRCRRRSPTFSEPVDWTTVRSRARRRRPADGDVRSRSARLLRRLRFSAPRFSCPVRSVADCRDYLASPSRRTKISRAFFYSCSNLKTAGVATQLPDAGGPVLGGVRGLDRRRGAARSGWAAGSGRFPRHFARAN